MNFDARRFVQWSLGLAVGLAGGVAGFNLVVDPYNRYGLNRLGVYISAERECKATYVGRYPHEALLIGNSRMVGTAPARLRGPRFFNASFAGASAEEVGHFLRHFAMRQRLVVLAIDLGMKDPEKPAGDLFAPRGLNSAFDNLFNLKTTEYSIRTISEGLSPAPQPIGPDGEVPVADWIRNADRDDPAAARFVIESMRRAWEGYRAPRIEQMSRYVEIRDMLRERGIPCVVVIPPIHEAVADRLREGPVADEIRAWKSQLSRIFPEVVDLSFSDYNRGTNFYRADPLHFKPDVGVRLMNEEVLPVAERLTRR